MRRPQKTERAPGRIIRLLSAAVLTISLSSLQAAWASIACLCQSLDRAESCECARGCDTTIYEKGAVHKTRDQSGTESSVSKAGLPNPQGMSCCEQQQQSEKPFVTFTSQPTIEIEDGPAFLLPHALAAVEAIRTHDPPRLRPLYVMHSCLLI